MKWNDEKDVALLREILCEEPYQYKPKSKERGNVWSKIAGNLNDLPSFNVTQRAVRDRSNLLIIKHKQKQRAELLASGIAPEETEIDTALEEALSRMNDAEVQYDKITEEKKENQNKEKADAEEMRRQSLETFVDTKKRKEADGEGSKSKRSRSSGSEIMTFLQESSYKKERDIALREHQFKQFVDSQSRMYEMFQQQQKNQQDQFQQLSNQQNVQMQGFLHIFNKLAEKF